jgi:hypothetical protein
MKRAGRKEPPYPNSAHHIVMSNSTHPDMKATRKHLKRLGIDIDDASNGVFLPTNTKAKTAAGTKAHPHSKCHTNRYKAEVRRRVTSKKTAAAAKRELRAIGDELRNGTFKL